MANSTKGVMDRVVATRNVFGLAAEGTGGGTGINIAVGHSPLNGSILSGIVATTGATGVGVTVMRSTVSHNATASNRRARGRRSGSASR